MFTARTADTSKGTETAIAAGPTLSFTMNGNPDTVGGGVMVSVSCRDEEVVGLDEYTLSLHGWSTETSDWEAISTQSINTGRNTVSDTLFAAPSTDITRPESVTDLRASTGSSNWTVDLT